MKRRERVGTLAFCDDVKQMRRHERVGTLIFCADKEKTEDRVVLGFEIGMGVRTVPNRTKESDHRATASPQ